MSFGLPSALWLLAVLPLIVVLYMLRARRHDVEVSSTLLWQRAGTELVAQRPVRRLERSVLLLLQLLAAALAALALARPQVPLAGAGRGTVIVLDASASMQATDVAPSRFSAAVAQASAAARSASGPVMLIEARARAAVVVPFGGPDAVVAALASAAPTDGPAQMDQAIALALGQRVDGVPPEILVFTDRAVDALPGVTYRIIGRSGANVAITGLHTEAGSGGTRVVVRVRRFGAGPRTVPLELTLNDRRVLARLVALPASGEAVVSTAVEGSGVLRARLDITDALAVDNTAAAIAGTPRPRVLVVGAPNRALMEALAVLPVRVARTSGVTPEQLAAADLVVLDRRGTVTLPPGNFLLIGTIPTNLPITSGGTVPRPSVVQVSAVHSVTRYVDLSAVRILETLDLQVRGGEVLVAGEVPLIWAYDGNGIRAVVMGFALDQSDLALHVAFPIFLQNAVTWLAGADAVLPAGSPLILPARDRAAAVLEGPSGRVSVSAAGGRFVVPALDRAGVYTFTSGNTTRVFAVVAPAEESDIAPVSAAGTGPPADRTTDTRRLADLWGLFIAGALILLAAEWLLWIRGLPRTTASRGPLWPRTAPVSPRAAGDRRGRAR